MKIKPAKGALFKKVAVWAARLMLVAFLALVSLGVYNCNNLIMGSDMTMAGLNHPMNDCLPGKHCAMDINQHLEIWQSLLTTILNTNLLDILVAIFLVLAIVVLIRKVFSLVRAAALICRYLYYEREHPESKLYNYLVGIFANGILQPKLFA